MADPPLAYADVADLLGMKIGSIGPTRARCLDKLRGLCVARRQAADPPEHGPESAGPGSEESP